VPLPALDRGAGARLEGWQIVAPDAVTASMTAGEAARD
jgi:hypothetical protein